MHTDYSHHYFSAVSVIFGVALFASRQSSTLTATLAGQIVM
jgi:Mn2+/Fe2+ NRAMP family transporter